jgi:hypothetical protein
MNRVAMAIAGTALAGVSFAIGRATAPDAPVLSVERVAPRVAGYKRAPEETNDALEECERKLALAHRVLDAKERAENGTPVPFPADLPPQYRPEGFEDAVKDAMRTCPQPGRRLARVDCSEFPCMAFFVNDSTAKEPEPPDAAPCDRWNELFGGWGGMATNEFMTDAGVVSFMMRSVAPADDATVSDENSQLRWTKRLEDGKAQVIADANGRELTPLEQLDREIEVVRDWDDSEKIVPMLEARRAKLVAEESAAR